MKKLSHGPMPKKSHFVPPSQIDEYVLLHKLGEGSMGQVWLARDTLLDRLVAIKFIRLGSPSNETKERFRNEARASARLDHPNVVATHRIGSWNDDPYIVSEYIVGKELSKLPKPVAWTVALQYGIGLASGLAAAHSRGVLHRDVKPDNILVTDKGEVKLLDFSVAKLVLSQQETQEFRQRNTEIISTGAGGRSSPLTSGEWSQESRQRPWRGSPMSADSMSAEPSELVTTHNTDASTHPDEAGALSSAAELGQPEQAPRRALTAPGHRVGTPRYMAPEIWRHEPASQEADIYSLGVVLYELCAGQTPYASCRRQDLERAVLETDAPSLASLVPSIDLKFAAIVDRCLRRDPEQRFRSSEMLRQALEEVCDPQRRALPIPEGNPYRGLVAFEEEHRSIFFGRSIEIGDILDRLRAEPMVIIAGDSGVGKSSLCRAGVLPELADGRLKDGRQWATVKMFPGLQPLADLADGVGPLLGMASVELQQRLDSDPAFIGTALRRHTEHQRGVIIFIDQLEELVTLQANKEREQFLDVLHIVTKRLPGVKVLATVRGDFLTRVLALLGPDQNQRGPYILCPLKRDGLYASIVEPARSKGVAFESAAMVDELINEAVDAEGGLPLLEFALAELWKRRDPSRRIIPAVQLREIGGVAGSLANYADQVLNRLPDGHRAIARRLLLMLVTPGGAPARRREEEMLSGEAEDRTVLESLVKGRLLVARQGSSDRGSTYELAHEALLSSWSTLRQWLDSNSHQRELHERIIAAAGEWERERKDPDLLWNERKLTELDRAGVAISELSVREQHFVRSSRRRVAWRRVVVRGLLLGILGLTALMSFFVVKWIELDKRQDSDEAKHLRAQARQPGQKIPALAEIINHIGGYLRHDQAPPPVWIEALSETLKANGPVVPPLQHDGAVLSVSYSSTGSQLVTGSADRTAAIWDAHTGTRLHTLAGHQGSVIQARFVPENGLIATASLDGTAIIWDASSGEIVHRLRRHTKALQSLAVSPDGTYVATASQDGTAILWDVRSGAVQCVLGGHDGPVNMVSFSSDGTRVVTASDDHTAIAWEVGSCRAQFQLMGHTAGVVTATFASSSSSPYILTASRDKSVRLWNALTGSSVGSAMAHQGRVSFAEFSPDGSRIVTAGEDMRLRVWDTTTQLRATLLGHSSTILAGRYSHDGALILSVSVDRTLRLWSNQTSTLLAVLKGHSLEVVAAAFSPDNNQVATASMDHTARIWDTRNGLSSKILRGHTGWIINAVFSPNGQYVLTPSGDGSVGMWDAKTGKRLHSFEGHQSQIRTAFFSPDGRRAATASYDGWITIWDAEHGDKLYSFQGHTKRVDTTRFSPDGLRLLTAGTDMQGRIWSLANLAEPEVTLKGHNGPIWQGEFSASGDRIVTASEDKTARIWDSRTGQMLHQLAHTENVTFANFSHSGRWVVTACDDGAVQLWDSKTGKLVWRQVKHTGDTQSVSFSPDDQRIVSAGYDSRVIIWDTNQGTVQRTLEGHEDAVWTAEFSPDGTRIVTASADSTVRLWDAASGTLMALFDGHISGVYSAVFSPDGNMILSSSDDQVARIVPGSVEELLRVGCTHLRYWPEFAQVKDYCEKVIAGSPQASRRQTSTKN